MGQQHRNYPLKNRRNSENWHYDKYKDPHEFPILDLSSEDEQDDVPEIDDRFDDIDGIDSSANLSKKIPQISDERFKQILDLRKQSKRKDSHLKVSNKQNNISPLIKRDKTSVSHLRDDKTAKRSIDNYLTSSTPKLNTVNGNSPASVSPNTKMNKDISPLLLSKRNDDIYSGKFIETFQEQVLRLNKLEKLLAEKEAQFLIFENDITKLHNENNQLIDDNASLNDKLKYLSESNKEFEEEIILLRAEKHAFEKKSVENDENYNNMYNQLKKERNLLKKECDVHKSVIQNYDIKLDSLNSEKYSMLKNLENEKNEVLYWKQKSEMFEKESKEVQKRIGELERENSELKKTSQNNINELKGKSDELIEMKIENNKVVDECTKNKTQIAELTQEIDLLNNKYNLLRNENRELSSKCLTIETGLNEKLKIAQNEIKNLNIERESSTSNEVQQDKSIPITAIQIGVKYTVFEMEQVDNLALIEAQNIIKNILISFNVKFSGLKQHVVFIRDYIFVFFHDIHNILHDRKDINNGESNKLNVTDEAKMKACMDILLSDVKLLKGVN